MIKDRVGFIGIGNMGGPIAAHIRRAGYELTACDPNPATHAPLVDLGARIVATARDVADSAEIVFACLPSQKISREAALGNRGLGDRGASGGSAIQIYVETSTIGTVAVGEITAGLSESNIQFFDAPISGGVPGARAGTLSTVSSGAHDVFDRVEPIFRTFAKNNFYLGDKPGQAQIAKLINNYLSTAGKIAAFEGAVMGAKAGLDVATLIDFINVSTGRNTATMDKFPTAILPRTFKFGGPMAINLKDMELFTQEAKAIGMPLWIAPPVVQLHVDAAAQGYKDRDALRLIEYIEGLAGVQIKATPPKSSIGNE
jgi:3-hydroxyisobutyrate dehydrogenase-like beta-hydroxyacid dehydrogenase